MIHLYNPGNENFDNNGDVVLLPSMCQVTAGINRTWQVDLEHPIDEYDRWKSIVIGAVLKTPSFNGTQLWRVVQTEKRDGGIVATCDPIFYDAAQDIILIDRLTLNNKTAQEVIDALCSGTKYGGTSHITEKKSLWYAQENLVEAMTGNEHGVVKSFDAEIGFDNFNVIIESQLGGDFGASVLYGKNLAVDGLTESVDIDDTVTRIIPIAYNGYKLPGDTPWVDSPLIDNYPQVRTRFIEYDNIRLEADRQGEGEESDSENIEYYETLDELYEALKEAAELEYSENEIDKPSVNLEIEMVQIQNTEEYKDFKDLEKISIGDVVRCRHARLDVDTTTRCRSLVYDCLTKSVISVELGKEKRNYFDSVSATIKNANKVITSSGTVIAQKIAGFIDGATTQLRVQSTTAKKQDARAILFEDLDPESESYGALAIGTQGLQISQERNAEDTDWIWTTAITAEGMIANVIIAGMLADKTGTSYWDLDNGEMSMSGVFRNNYTSGDMGILMRAGRIFLYGTQDPNVRLGRLGVLKVTDGDGGGAFLAGETGRRLSLGIVKTTSLDYGEGLDTYISINGADNSISLRVPAGNGMTQVFSSSSDSKSVYVRTPGASGNQVVLSGTYGGATTVRANGVNVLSAYPSDKTIYINVPGAAGNQTLLYGKYDGDTTLMVGGQVALRAEKNGDTALQSASGNVRLTAPTTGKRIQLNGKLATLSSDGYKDSVSGSFTTANGKTVSVLNGIIVGIS